MDPEIAALLAEFGVGGPEPAEPPSVAELRAVNRALSLAVAPSPPREVGSVADEHLVGVPVRVYRPRADGAPGPTVVFFHGGGFVLGDLDTHDGVARRLCRDLGAVVVSVGYRLAPEFPFPAAFDDCTAVATHVGDHLDSFGGGGALGLAGDSAGGNLAAGVSLAFRDEGRSLTALLLAYPATDLSPGPAHASRSDTTTGDPLTGAEVERDIALYLGEDSPYAGGAPASPLLAADHAGLAPTVIGVGDCDPLRDEGMAYAQALADAGVQVQLHLYPGLIHGFLSFDSRSKAADAAATELIAEFGALLGGADRR